MSGSATYQLSERDLIESQRAWFDAMLRTPMIAIVVAAVLLVGAGILLLDPFPGRRHVALAALPVAGAIVAALVLLAPRWAIRRQAGRIAAQNRGLRLEHTVEWDQQGIRFTSSHGQARLQWTELYRWQLTPTLLLLCLDETQFHPLPLRALGRLETEEIVGLLETAGVPKQGRGQALGARTP